MLEESALVKFPFSEDAETDGTLVQFRFLLLCCVSVENLSGCVGRPCDPSQM